MRQRSIDVQQMRLAYSMNQEVWDLLDAVEAFGSALTSIRDDDWQETDRGPRDIAADALFQFSGAKNDARQGS